jgi:hypothetical protein
MSVAIETPSIPAAPARRRSALARLTVTELTLFLREPMLVFWVIAFPLLLLVIFGLIPSFKETHPGYQGLTVLETYVPIIILTMLALLSFFSLPVTLATYREQRILRRLQTTPAGAWRVLAAQLAVTVGAGVVMVAAILVLGRLAFAVPFPLAPGIWVVVALLTAACTLSLGLFIAAAAGSRCHREHPVLPADVLLRAVAADPVDAGGAAAHQPRDAARRGLGVVPGGGPRALAARAGPRHHGGVRDGIIPIPGTGTWTSRAP